MKKNFSFSETKTECKGLGDLVMKFIRVESGKMIRGKSYVSSVKQPSKFALVSALNTCPFPGQTQVQPVQQAVHSLLADSDGFALKSSGISGRFPISHPAGEAGQSWM